MVVLGSILLAYGIAKRDSIEPGDWMQIMILLALAVFTGSYAWSASRQAQDARNLVAETRKSLYQAARARRDLVRSEHNWKLYEHKINPGLPGLPDPSENEEYWKWRIVHLSHLNLLHTEWLDFKAEATRREDLEGWQKWAILLSQELSGDLNDATERWKQENLGKIPELTDLREFRHTSLRLRAMLDISLLHKWDLLPDNFVVWLRDDCGFQFLPGR